MGPTIASSLVHKINIKEPTTSVFVDCWVKRVIMLIGLDHRTICWAASQRRVRAAPKCSNPREVPSSRRTLIMVTFFYWTYCFFSVCMHSPILGWPASINYPTLSQTNYKMYQTTTLTQSEIPRRQPPPMDGLHANQDQLREPSTELASRLDITIHVHSEPYQQRARDLP